MDGIGGVLTAVIPSVGVGLLFWFAMRAIMNADRPSDMKVKLQQAKFATKKGDKGGDVLQRLDTSVISLKD